MWSHKLLVYAHIMAEPKRHIGADAKQMALIELGARLRRARVNKRIPQRVAAQRIGTSTQTIRNWEAGRHEADPQAVAALAEFYGVTTNSLLYGEGNDAVRLMQTSLRGDQILIDSEKLRQARLGAKMSLPEVTRLTGISPFAIGLYEKGERYLPAGTMEALSGIYGQPLESFTPRGYFTPEELQLLDLPAQGDGPGGGEEAQPITLILDALLIAKDDLTMENARTIVEFIRFTHGQKISPQRRAELYGPS